MVCYCVLAGTKACEMCYNNIGTYSWSKTVYYEPDINNKKTLEKVEYYNEDEELKNLLKQYLKKVINE